MYGNMARGMGSYNAGASAISSNAMQFRSDVDNIKSSNKALVQSTYAANDLKHLYDIGTEGAIRALKPMIGKGLGHIYEKTGLKEWDNKATQAVSDFRKKLGMEESPETNSVDGNPSASAESPSSEVSGTQGGSSEGLDTEPRIARPNNPNTNEEFQRGQGSDETARGSTELDDVSSERPFIDETPDPYGRADTSQRVFGETKDDRDDMEEDDGPTDPGPTRGTDGVAPEDGPADAGADVGGDVAADAGGEAGTEALGAGEEAVGTALDATGVGAIIGVPMQILGGLTELFGGYEAAKGIGEWFNQDILGNHPKVPQVKLPSAPTIDNANLAIPSFDSVQDAPTSSGSW